jgi:dihydroflavonol-4-reductase
MDPVFVTGGTGFVGGHLLDHLAAAGHPVRALVRSPQAARDIEERGATAVVGHVLDETSLRSGMAGCVVAYHVAGVNVTCPSDPAELYRTNIGGTRHVIRAAAAAGVPRVVYTSSVTALGTPPGVIGNESSPSRGHFPSHYARSKHLGERAAFDEGARQGVDVVAVLPASVQGPGRSEGSARIFRYALQARRPIVVPVAVSIIDVRDCTAAHVLAAQRGVAGERYVASGATHSAVKILEALSRIVARPIRPIVVPTRLAAILGYPLAAVAALLPGDRDLCPELFRTLLHDHRYDGTRAVRDLGLTYTPFPATLRRIVAWLQEQGLIGPG